MYDHTGRGFTFDAEGLPSEYHTISEEAAIQMLPMMDAVRSEPRYDRAIALAEAIAGMNHCEAGLVVRTVLQPEPPSEVMQALALMHG